MKVRLIGGVCSAKAPGQLELSADDTATSAGPRIAAIIKAPPAVVAKAKVCPVIKGAKGDPMGPAETFSSRGVGDNDILFIALPPPPAPAQGGKSPAGVKSPPPAGPSATAAKKAPPAPGPAPKKAPPPAASPPTSPTAAKKSPAPPMPTAAGKKQVGGPPPVRAGSPPIRPGSPAIPAPPMPGKAKKAAPSPTGGVAPAPPMPTASKKKAPPPPPQASPPSPPSSANSSSGDDGDSSDGGGGGGPSSPFHAAFASAFQQNSAGNSSSKKGNNKAGSSSSNNNKGRRQPSEGSDSGSGGSNDSDSDGPPPPPSKPASKKPVKAGPAPSQSGPPVKGGPPPPSGSKGAPTRPAMPVSKNNNADNSLSDATDSSYGGGSGSDNDDSHSPATAPRSTTGGGGGSRQRAVPMAGSMVAPPPPPSAEAIEATVKAQMDALLERQSHVAAETTRALQGELAASVTEEMKRARAEMLVLWETQRGQALEQLEKHEEKRLQDLKTLSEREADLHATQSKFIEALKQRRVTEEQNDAQLEEMFRCNRDLRDELRKRREVSDQRIQAMADAHKKHALNNPDTRVDALLLIQAQIAQSLKAFNTLPTHKLLPQHGGAGGPAAGADSAAPTPLPLFLASLGLDRFLEPLRAQDVTTAALLRMNDADLQAAGVATLGARKMILMEAERRRETSTHGAAAGVAAQRPHASAATSSTSTGSLAAGSSGSSHTANSGGRMVDAATVANLHARVLKNTFRRYDADRRLPQVDAIIAAFYWNSANPHGSMDDVYYALAQQYHIRRSSYRPQMLAFLTARVPPLIGAVDVICDVFEGREAEFGDMVEMTIVGLVPAQLPAGYPNLWCTVQDGPASSTTGAAAGSSSSRSGSPTPKGSKSKLKNAANSGGEAAADKSTHNSDATAGQSVYYYSAMCGLSQHKEPRKGIDTYKVRDRTLSVRYPTNTAHLSIHLQRALKIAGPAANATSGLHRLPNPQNFEPNPAINDDASSYDRLYVALIAAHFIREYPNRLDACVPLLKQHRGRESDLFHKVRTGQLGPALL